MTVDKSEEKTRTEKNGRTKKKDGKGSDRVKDRAAKDKGRKKEKRRKRRHSRSRSRSRKKSRRHKSRRSKSRSRSRHRKSRRKRRYSRSRSRKRRRSKSPSTKDRSRSGSIVVKVKRDKESSPKKKVKVKREKESSPKREKDVKVKEESRSRSSVGVKVKVEDGNKNIKVKVEETNGKVKKESPLKEKVKLKEESSKKKVKKESSSKRDSSKRDLDKEEEKRRRRRRTRSRSRSHKRRRKTRSRSRSRKRKKRRYSSSSSRSRKRDKESSKSSKSKKELDKAKVEEVKKKTVTVLANMRARLLGLAPGSDEEESPKKEETESSNSHLGFKKPVYGTMSKPEAIKIEEPKMPAMPKGVSMEDKKARIALWKRMLNEKKTQIALEKELKKNRERVLAKAAEEGAKKEEELRVEYQTKKKTWAMQKKKIEQELEEKIKKKREQRELEKKKEEERLLQLSELKKKGEVQIELLPAPVFGGVFSRTKAITKKMKENMKKKIKRELRKKEGVDEEPDGDGSDTEKKEAVDLTSSEPTPPNVKSVSSDNSAVKGSQPAVASSTSTSPLEHTVPKPVEFKFKAPMPKIKPRRMINRKLQPNPNISFAGPSKDFKNEPEEKKDEDIDPLDLFMSNLGIVNKKKVNKKRKEVREVFENETPYEERDMIIEEEETWKRKSNAKEIKQVDHNTRKYEPFKKNFYIEAREIRMMTDEQVKKYRAENLEGVSIVGTDCPKPIKRWSQAGLPDRVMKAMAKMEYARPFPIQAQAIPAIMCGRDVIACAKTGSGKTAAFVLPMIRHIIAQPPLGPEDGPIGLIICPTRELCCQLYQECKKFLNPCKLNVVPIYGGSQISQQIAKLKMGCETVCCTPGRMIEILCANQGRVTNLHRVTYLVLDEADRMFDMGFEPQIIMMVKNIRPDRQTVMFSATFPKSIEALARQALRNPIQILIGKTNTASGDVKQHAEIVNEDQRFRRLLQLLGHWYGRGNILIFHDKREAVDNLFQELAEVGYMALCLHGGIDQTDRDYNIMDFKNKIRTIMIATSCCARGLDVKDLKLVVNFTAPHDYEDYIHRIGRTGRAGQKGVAYTFLGEEEYRAAPIILKAMNKAHQFTYPPKLKEMAKTFHEKVAAGEERIYANSGFMGKGFKFDDEEGKKSEMIKKRQLGIYGTDEDKDKDAIEDTVESLGSIKKKVDALKEEGKVENELARQIKRAKVIFQQIKKMQEQGAASGQIRREVNKAHKVAKRDTEKRKKKQAQLTAKKYHYQISSKGQGNFFTMSLEINDYPQYARRKILYRNEQEQVREWYGVNIEEKGVFVPIGRRPQPGEDKLHIILSGPTESAVTTARQHIIKMLNEAAANSRPEEALGSFRVV